MGVVCFKGASAPLPQAVGEEIGPPGPEEGISPHRRGDAERSEAEGKAARLTRKEDAHR